jgi:cytochrome c biogenesis protein CcmG, thiol:disulfide interchange protein DsbE
VALLDSHGAASRSEAQGTRRGEMIHLTGGRLPFLPVPKRSYIPIIAGLVGTALVGLLVYGVSAQSPTRTLDDAVIRGLHPAAPAAGYALPLLSGHGHGTLASYDGEVVVLNFWASWCEPCREEAPRLEHVQRELARHGGTVLGVTFRDASPDSLSFVRRYHLTYPNLDDTTGEFAHAYGTNELPESFVIDRHGRVVAISRHEASEAFLGRAVSLAESS